VQTGHAFRYVPKRPRQLYLTSIRERRTLCNSHANILGLPLLEAVICGEMQRILGDTLPPVSQWDRSTLHLFIQTALECCDGKYSYLRLSKNMVPQFERAAHEGMVELLLEWLKHNVRIRPQVPLETIAHIMSCAIVGAAVQRCQTTMTISADEMANAVLLVIMEGVEQML
jgi:hypothetical protein